MGLQGLMVHVISMQIECVDQLMYSYMLHFSYLVSYLVMLHFSYLVTLDFSYLVIRYILVI